MSGAYTLGDHSFESRLIIGTGKYESFEQNLKCVEVSGSEMVTVALRRETIDGSAATATARGSCMWYSPLG